MERCVQRAGFAINPKKSRMQYCDSRQDATGLVVNEKINVPKEYYKLARAMCWELTTKGIAFEKNDGAKTPINHNILRGKLSYIYHIKRWDDERRDASIEDVQKSCYHRVYADFLNYTAFFGLEQPTIVCEGKTDNIYLRCALRSLTANYPTLVQEKDGKKNLLVRLFKFTKTAQSGARLVGRCGSVIKST